MTTKAKPTPGPLRYSTIALHNPDRAQLIRDNTIGTPVLNVEPLREDQDENEANFALIETAFNVATECETLGDGQSAIEALPNLLRIAQRLADNKSGEVIVYNNIRHDARSVLAKVKGEKTHAAVDRQFKARNHKLATRLIHNLEGRIVERIGDLFNVEMREIAAWETARYSLTSNPDYGAYDIDRT